jgi:hypothetical protein
LRILKKIIFGVLICCINSFGLENGVLIFSGLDTLHLPIDKGFDFVTSTVCTVYSSSNCILHFDFQYYPPSYKYMIFVSLGYAVNAGKVNLDSIKTAPTDSVFWKNTNSRADSIPPDSLSSRIGNVYVIKTGTDPRPVWNQPFYAKIKIIKFIVIDSASHQIKMVFLWTFNRSGYRDLTTAGLDTFHLDSTPVSANGSRLPRASLSSSAAVFKVVTGKFTVPASLAGTSAFLAIYNLAGKKLGRVAVGNNRVIDLRQFGVGRGVVVVRVEREKII